MFASRSHRRCRSILEVLPDAGAALLLVVGATAAISTLALATLSASFMLYETAVLRRDGTQARLLAESVIPLVVVDLAHGAITPPSTIGVPVLWRGSVPAPPAGFDRVDPKCRLRARLSVAPAPTGGQYVAMGDGLVARLVDVFAEGWCGRGYHAKQGRLAIGRDGSVVRLY